MRAVRVGLVAGPSVNRNARASDIRGTIELKSEPMTSVKLSAAGRVTDAPASAASRRVGADC